MKIINLSKVGRKYIINKKALLPNQSMDIDDALGKKMLAKRVYADLFDASLYQDKGQVDVAFENKKLLEENKKLMLQLEQLNAQAAKKDVPEVKDGGKKK